MTASDGGTAAELDAPPDEHARGWPGVAGWCQRVVARGRERVSFSSATLPLATARTPGPPGQASRRKWRTPGTQGDLERPQTRHHDAAPGQARLWRVCRRWPGTGATGGSGTART